MTEKDFVSHQLNGSRRKQVFSIVRCFGGRTVKAQSEGILHYLMLMSGKVVLNFSLLGDIFEYGVFVVEEALDGIWLFYEYFPLRSGVLFVPGHLN